jgi:formylglycine-generating enzyme required for sulfatase activity
MGASGRERFPLDGEGPQRKVGLSEFSISCYAVTNAQFADFVRDTGYLTDAERFGWSFVFDGLIAAGALEGIETRAAETPWWVPVPRAYWAQPEGPHSSVLERPHHPVVHVSWNDASAYCRWAHARLPTEAEWECAARGGLGGALYPWGNELMPDGEHRCNIWQGSFPDRNTADDGYAGTAPVDAYPSNGYGIYNMAGNVWEWCQDFFSPAYHRTTAAKDPLQTQPSAARSMRGGSFLCHDSYCNRYRVAARSSNTPDSSSSNIGFRVVRDGTRGGQAFMD